MENKKNLSYLYDIHLYGVEEKLIDRIWIKELKTLQK